MVSPEQMAPPVTQTSGETLGGCSPKMESLSPFSSLSLNFLICKMEPIILTYG